MLGHLCHRDGLPECRRPKQPRCFMQMQENEFVYIVFAKQLATSVSKRLLRCRQIVSAAMSSAILTHEISASQWGYVGAAAQCSRMSMLVADSLTSTSSCSMSILESKSGSPPAPTNVPALFVGQQILWGCNKFIFEEIQRIFQMPLLSKLSSSAAHCNQNCLFTIMTLFLDASSHLYKRVCPSVGRSIHWSVSRLVGRSVPCLFDH